MHTIPLTVFDNFLDEIDEVRAFALSQEFEPSEAGRWAGARTKSLAELNLPLFQLITSKFFALFYDYTTSEVRWEVDAMFQKVTKDFDNGWVHSDEDSIVTGILFLTPDAPLNGGTSLYRKKKDVFRPDVSSQQIKQQFMRGEISIEEMLACKNEYENQFEETADIKNVYNRIVGFDSHLFHKANNYFGESDDDARLTLVFFANKIYNNNTPIHRAKRFI